MTGSEIKVLCTHAFHAAMTQVGSEFEKQTGNKLVITYGTTGDLVKRMTGGQPADLVIATAPAVQSLVKSGKVVEGSNRSIASTGIGIAVRAGAPKPDISSVEALRNTLLAAKSIAYSDPADGAASGIHFAKVLQRLGIADQVKSKSKLIGGGGDAGEFVAKGGAEIAVRMTSELLPVPGITYVGPLPDELQDMIVFAAGICANGTQRDGAKSLIDFLSSPAVEPKLKSTGLEPVSPTVPSVKN
jgi:molybdate transport system substrate-binding protein